MVRKNRDIDEFAQETFSSVMKDLMEFDYVAYIRENNSENDSKR